jgi:hypothetical protein
MLATGASLAEVADNLGIAYPKLEVLKVVLGHAASAKGREDLEAALAAASHGVGLEDAPALRGFMAEGNLDPMLAAYLPDHGKDGLGQALLADRGVRNPAKAIQDWKAAGSVRYDALNRSRDISIELLWSLTACLKAAHPDFRGLRIVQEDQPHTEHPEYPNNKSHDVYVLMAGDNPREEGRQIVDFVDDYILDIEECDFRDAAWMIFSHPEEEVGEAYWFMADRIPAEGDFTTWWPIVLEEEA